MSDIPYKTFDQASSCFMAVVVQGVGVEFVGTEFAQHHFNKRSAFRIARRIRNNSINICVW